MDRVCKKCNTTKELSTANFRLRLQNGYEYYNRTCNKCVREKAKLLARQARATTEGKARYGLARRKNHLKEKYDITVEQYEELLSQQNGACAICKRTEDQAADRRLSVDHCHETGEIRGILCGACNRAVGLMYDSSDLLREAALYLESTDKRPLRKAA